MGVTIRLAHIKARELLKKGFNLKATPSSVKADHTKMYNFQDPAVQEEAFQNK